MLTGQSAAARTGKGQSTAARIGLGAGHCGHMTNFIHLLKIRYMYNIHSRGDPYWGRGRVSKNRPLVNYQHFRPDCRIIVKIPSSVNHPFMCNFTNEFTLLLINYTTVKRRCTDIKSNKS